VRFCTQPDCTGIMEASSMNAKKMTCPDCSNSICFRCRENWHGYFTSCEDALEEQFNFGTGVDRIIFCPTCRTKIQRTEGCNHMTCAFCRYEFCYFCGADASSGSSHWAPGMGCGATMMGGGTVRSPCCNILVRLLMILGCILAYPFIVVLTPPIIFTIWWYMACFHINVAFGCCCILLIPIPLAIGLCFNICWSPFALIAFPAAAVAMIG